MRDWRNRLTREAYLFVLETWEDPVKIGREWLEMHQGSAVKMLARQVRRDIRDTFAGHSEQGPCGEHDCLSNALCLAGLRRVDWLQVAERLLARTVLAETEAAKPEAEKGNEGAEVA